VLFEIPVPKFGFEIIVTFYYQIPVPVMSGVLHYPIVVIIMQIYPGFGYGSVYYTQIKEIQRRSPSPAINQPERPAIFVCTFLDF
jgi:hypothetical protein